MSDVKKSPEWYAGYLAGAAVAFGIVGMFEALRERERRRPREEADAAYERAMAKLSAADEAKRASLLCGNATESQEKGSNGE